MSYKNDKIGQMMIHIRKTITSLILNTGFDDETKSNIQSNMMNTLLDLGALIGDGSAADMVLEDFNHELAQTPVAEENVPVQMNG